MSSLQASDADFIATFERAEFGAHDFPHRAHLRMAWLYVRRLGTAAAAERVTTGVRALASAHGHPERYHETLTVAWVYLVGAAVDAHPDIAGFDEFIAAHGSLLDKQLLLRHYSAQRLSSAEARAAWVAADLAPIPGAPPSAALRAAGRPR